jgi:hypothetical protein
MKSIRSKGAEYDHKYNHSEKGRARRRRYNVSQKGKLQSDKYNHTEKGRLRIRRYEGTSARKRAKYIYRVDHTPITTEQLWRAIIRWYKTNGQIK